MNDEYYMALAIEEALKGKGFTNPNPMVGAVIIKNDKIISKSYHKKYGGFHAERNAINECKESLNESTIYVTLEPCCHYGKTPPCTEIIIKSGIKRVVIGSTDPNPLVAGKGIDILKAHGIEVTTGVLEEKCLEINQVFFHYISKKKPYVIMKYAMTADGKIATHLGNSKWITNEASRANVQETRGTLMAIMVGVGTIVTDNPMLTCRLNNKRSPIRLICDTNLRTPLYSKVVLTAKEYKTILITCCNDNKRQEDYLKSGCELLVVGKDKNNEFIDLNEAMTLLAERNIDSILLEGGAELNYSALQSGIVNKVQAYIAPKIFGGFNAKTPIGGIGVEKVNECFKLEDLKISKFDEDLLLEWKVVY